MAEDREVQLSAGGSMTLNDSDPHIPAKPKRARKAKESKPPKVEKAKRTRSASAEPVQTLKYRVTQMGPNHAEAFRILSKRDGLFADGLRDEIAWRKNRDAVASRVVRAEDELAAAKKALADFPRPSFTFSERLDRLADTLGKEAPLLPEMTRPADSDDGTHTA